MRSRRVGYHSCVACLTKVPALSPHAHRLMAALGQSGPLMDARQASGPLTNFGAVPPPRGPTEGIASLPPKWWAPPVDLMGPGRGAPSTCAIAGSRDSTTRGSPRPECRAMRVAAGSLLCKGCPFSSFGRVMALSHLSSGALQRRQVSVDKVHPPAPNRHAGPAVE